MILYRYESQPDFNIIEKEIAKELEYVEKQIKRIEDTNAIKRSFIKGSVKKKFNESAERIQNIARTILVYQVDKKNDDGKFRDEITNVQIRIDDISRQLEENKEKADLDNIRFVQPIYHRRKTREEGVGGQK